MHIFLNRTSMVPIYEQLVDQIKREIIKGELKDDDMLPSVRTLSGELRISSLTVKKAYDKLEEDGLVVTVHGKGTFVVATDQQLAMEARRKSIEEEMGAAIEKAIALGMSKEEILEIVTIIMEEYR